MQHQPYKMPPHLEDAIGYIAAGGRGGWVGIYRTSSGRVVWSDGTLQHPLPGGLTEILEGLWGELVRGYGYLLDLETRRAQRLSLKALMPFLQDVAGATTPLEAHWLKDDSEAQGVARSLVDYAEGLLGGTVAEPCGDCYYGYSWVATLSAFAPCAWCYPLEP